MNQGTIIAMLPRSFHLKTSDACCSRSQLGHFPHLLEQLFHLSSLDVLPFFQFQFKPGPETPQIYFLYSVAICLQTSGVPGLKEKNVSLETKTFTLAWFCFGLHHARPLDGLFCDGKAINSRFTGVPVPSPSEAPY